MPSFGPLEIGIILVIILIIFGAGKLPQVFGAIGKGINEFRKGRSGEYGEVTSPELESKDKGSENKET
jgi:sec-independent protein translocase protein TatA